MSQHDPVNAPRHYTHSKIQPVEVVEDWQLGFHLGNTVKYICRAGRKDGESYIQDLEKARWYLDRYIKLLKQGGSRECEKTQLETAPSAQLPVPPTTGTGS